MLYGGLSMSWKETYQLWKNNNSLNELIKEDLTDLETDPEQLEDAFYKSLEFGTAGMRGKVGAGTNRMNIYTIRQATEGLAQFLLANDEEAKERGVVIGYDSRHYSKEFALEAAKTLGHHGIKTFVFDDLRPTPEVSFGIRYLKAIAGIMITASHNPPEYNGYKVYNEDGAQFLPEKADELTRYVKQVAHPFEVKVGDQRDLKEKGLLKFIGAKIDKGYLGMMRSVSLNPKLIEDNATELKIVYTPLHGTGQKLAKKALYNAGFQRVYDVPSQSEPDPDFSTVKTPNPEEREAFDEAIKVGIEKDADIIIATDPDADRLGVAVKTIPGEYTILTGNQIASLMTEYILKTQFENGLLPKYPLIIKSIVSSDLPTRIANQYGARVENVLTGFKFIAERIETYEESMDTVFMFGFEESYGYLTRPFVRDKDAIQATVLLSEIALSYKLKNYTLVDALLDLYHRYGHFQEKVLSVTLEGKKGQDKINQIMTNLRENSPKRFGESKVTYVEDFLSSQRIFEDGIQETIELPKSNVLKFSMHDGSWIAVRPSGTEPKIKFYLSAVDGSKFEVDNKMIELEKAVNEILNV